MRERVLLTDVDNTLFSWVDYFAPCFRALVHALSKETGFSEDELYTSFQLVFQTEGTVEYKKAVQRNKLISSLSPTQQERLVGIATVAFGRTMRKRLRPYPDVVPTLRRLQADGVRIVAVTNSGALQAMLRIHQLGLAKLLDGLVAWDHDVAGEVETVGNYVETVKARARSSGLNWVLPLPRDSLKPNASAYLVALERLHARDPMVWIIGDSLEKDLSVATKLSAVSVWAKYGHAFEQKNFETLLRITHWTEEKIRATYDTTVLRPDHVVEDFQALLTIVPLSQRTLF